MLSRLKGIETFNTATVNNRIANALDMLSRLKGIETGEVDSVRLDFNHFLWICFPV